MTTSTFVFFNVLGEEAPDVPRWDVLNQEEIQQLVEEIQDAAEHVNAMNVSLEKAVKQLRAAADFLDKVWKDCKIASAVGTGANITGGVLGVLGGVATVMTAGAATPFLIAGAAFGVAGSLTNLGTSAVEAHANSTVIQEADDAVQNANGAIQKVRNQINMLKTGKSQVRLVFLAGLAIRMLGKNHLLVAFIKDLLRTDLLSKTLPSITSALQAVSGLARAGLEGVTTVAGRELIESTSKEALSIGVSTGARKFSKTGAKLAEKAARKAGTKLATRGARKVGTEVGARAAGKAGAKEVSKGAGNAVTKQGTSAISKAGAQNGAKAAGGVIVGVSAAFLVLDVIDLAFTVRDIVQDEGSDAARSLRDKADKYEAILNEQ